ncbi:MAG TPA: IPTL-CTERM sorting domain-containing protein [Flavilitoribacter sp.]|nr:IPTL-CTERM sorting domain-containing protein [Flavilitoribacter sp.]
MKRIVHLFSVFLFAGTLGVNALSAQDCVQLGTTVSQLTPLLKEVGGFCGAAAVQTATCDCPAGYVAVGYEGLEGNTWGPMVLSQFKLRCRQLNSDGSLGATVVTTCANGSHIGTSADGPIEAGAGQALVGFEVGIGCAIDAIMGQSKSILDVANSLPNSTSTPMTAIGGTGGSPQPAMFVPNGNVIVGMQTYEDASLLNTAGVAWRYAPIIICEAGCSITNISFANASGCNDGGTDDNSSDDTFTADVTVTFSNPPATGNLVLSGPATASVPVGSLSGGSHTFTGVTMATTGHPVFITASFSGGDCSLTDNAGVAPASCSPNAPIEGIPTMSEWGLILFALIIFTMSVVFGMQRKEAMAMAQSNSSAPFDGRMRLPFDRGLYFRVLPVVYLAIGAIFTLAILTIGYQPTAADLPGSILAGAVVAYLAHFAMMNSRSE